jgi:hypothetical protein
MTSIVPSNNIKEKNTYIKTSQNIIVDNFIENNKKYLPTKFDDIKIFKDYKRELYQRQKTKNIVEKDGNFSPITIQENDNKEINVKWYDITKDDHPLWTNENTLPKRLTRFVDERYILTDTTQTSQQAMVVLSIIIIIITIIELFIREYKNEKYNLKNTNETLMSVLSGLKLLSGCIFLYYFIPNLFLRTSKPNDDTIQLDKPNN